MEIWKIIKGLKNVFSSKVDWCDEIFFVDVNKFNFESSSAISLIPVIDNLHEDIS